MQAIQRTAARAALAAAFAAVAATAVHAAPKPASAPAATPAAPAASVAIDAEKQKAIDRVLAVWHPENAMIAGARMPAQRALEQSLLVMQQRHIAQDKIDATLKDMRADAEKYADKVGPIAKASALKMIPSTIVPALAQNFSTDELKQVAAMLESPVLGKFQQFNGLADQALGKRVEADIGAEINKEVTALNQTIGNKLRAAVGVTTN